MKGFRDFILRGNVVDLAIAVVIGTVFGAVVASFTADLLTPLIAAIAGKPDFAELTFTINGSVFRYGRFLNAVITFLIAAGVVYFFVVKPLGVLMQKYKPTPEPAGPTKDCPECLSSIPAAATKCAFCTTTLTAAA